MIFKFKWYSMITNNSYLNGILWFYKWSIFKWCHIVINNSSLNGINVIYMILNDPHLKLYHLLLNNPYLNGVVSS